MSFVEDIQKKINELKNNPELREKHFEKIKKEEQEFKVEIERLVHDYFGKKYTSIFEEKQVLYKEKIDKIIQLIIKGKNLMLSGNCGTGKTMTLLYLFKQIQLTEKKLCACFYFFPKLIDRLFQGEEVKIRKYMFLDDIGTEYLSDFGLSQLEVFIEEIYRRDHRILGSTNIPKKEFLERKNFQRIADRINQNCIWITLPGESRRK